MKHFRRWFYFLLAPVCLGAVTAAAQNQNPNQGMPAAPMVEIFGCTYNGDNDLEDLIAVSNRWNGSAGDSRPPVTSSIRHGSTRSCPP